MVKFIESFLLKFIEPVLLKFIGPFLLRRVEFFRSRDPENGLRWRGALRYQGTDRTTFSVTPSDAASPLPPAASDGMTGIPSLPFKICGRVDFAA